MAIIKLGSIATDIVGKVGGQVFQQSEYGTVIRNNHFRRSRQNAVNYKRRALIGYLSTSARNLSDSARTICANNGAQFTRATKQGPATPYNWYSWYMSFGFNRLLIGLLPIATAVTPTPEPNWDSFAIGDESGTTNWEITGIDDFDNTWTAVIRASAPVVPGAAFRRGKMKIIQISAGASGPIAITRANYNTVFGNIPSGSYCYFQVDWIFNATGQAAGPKITKADAQ